MREQRLRRDFERFRRDGDAAALGRVFDRAAGELFRVACHLVRDPVEAEDLLQATFLAAIERADRWDAARPLSPWLFGILARKASESRRRARRDRDLARERAGDAGLRPAPSPSADEAGAGDPAAADPPDLPGEPAASTAGDPHALAAAREVSEELERALDALPAKVREVLGPFLREGRPAAEIARDLGRAPGTVRMQVHRGLALLRKRLPAGLAGALALASAPRGLAAVRESVMARAAEAAAPLRAAALAGSPTPVASAGAASATALGSVLGGLTMAKAIWLAAAAAAVAAGALWTWTRDDRPAEPAELARSAPERAAVARPRAPEAGPLPAPAAAADAPRRSALAGDAPAPGDDPREASTEPAGDRGSLEGTVAYASDGGPAADVGLELLDWSTTDARARALELRTDARGRFHVADLAPGRYALELDRAPGQTDVDVRAGEVARAALELPRGLDVVGRVVDDAGRGVARAELWLTGGGFLHETRRVGRAGADGRFLLRSVDSERHLGARADGHAPSPMVMVRTLPDDSLRADGHAASAGPAGDGSNAPGAPGDAPRQRVVAELVLRAGAGVVAGRVTAPDGSPVAGAQVRVGSHRVFPRRTAEGLGTTAPAPLTVRTDADGRYEAPGIAPGLAPVAVRAAGHPAWSGEVLVSAGARVTLDARLAPGAVVAGRVLDADGEPARGAIVTLRGAGAFRSPVAPVGPDGRYELRDVPPGTAALRAELGPWTREGVATAVEGELEVRAGERARWDARLARGLAIRGVALDDAGRPLAGLEVRALQTEPFAKLGALVVTDREGRFELTGLLDMGYWVELMSSHGSMQLARAAGVRPGGPPLTLRVDPERMPSATVTGVVLDPAGRPARGFATIDAVDHTGQLGAELDAQGRFALGPVPPGDHRLTVWPVGFAQHLLDVDDLAARETRDLGTKVLPEPAALVVRLRRDDGGPLEGVQVSAGRVGASLVSAEPGADGRVEFARLGVGAHYVQAHGPTVLNQFRPVELVAGETLELELVLRSGPRQEIVVAVPAGQPAVEYLSVRIDDADGRLAAFQSLHEPAGGRRFELGQHLPAGEYVLVATGDAGTSATREFTVAGAPGAPLRVELAP